MKRRILSTLLACLFCLLAGQVQAQDASNPRAASPGGSLPGSASVWRVRVLDAAVVSGDVVHLGEIARPLGNMSQQEWQNLAARPLWPAPDVAGKPLQINKQRLQIALRQSLGDLADSFILPNSLVIQKGGAVMMEEDLRSLVVKTLTPQINQLGGHGELDDFRLPAYAFTAHPGQSVILEATTVAPGRIGLRFAVQEMDGSIVRRFTGSVFLNLWMDVPSLNRPLNRGEAVTPDVLSFVSANLAYQKGAVWDGRGGPWQVVRSIGAGQPILAADLAPLAAIHRGDKITLVYNRGNVQLRVLVEALEDGGLGDTIAVRNLDSKKQVFATVLDQNTVQTK